MKYLEVGEIVKTHGIKGEVKVYIITDNLKRFNKGSVLFMGPKKEKIVIDSSRMHQNMMLIAFNGLKSINDVEKYVGNTLYYDTSYDKGDESGFYYDDLIGCTCIVCDNPIGIVKDIMDLPQGPALEIKMNEENLETQEEIIKIVPFIKEFISKTDIEKKEIYITPIEGLL